MNKMKKDSLNFEKNRNFFDSMAKFYEDNKKRIELTRNDYSESLKKVFNTDFESFKNFKLLN